MTAAEFRAAGLYDPAAPPARLELLEWLAAQGVTLTDMREAQLRWGALSGLAGDLALRAGERLTLAEVAARSGMSPERIEGFNLAAAFPPVGPEERVFDPGTVAMFASFAAAEQFFGQGPLLHFIRVLGSSVARIAEAAVSLFLANVEAAIVERGASELALAQANLRAVQLLDTIPNAVRAMFRAQVEIAIRRFRAARAERAMQDTVRLTVGFVDLVGYTRLSQQLDAVMFVAVDPSAACDIALTLLERFAGDPAVTPRGGLAEGRLLARGGDYYGSAVNLASRLGELAVPREVLATAEVASAAARARFRFEPAGRRLLKGFDAPVALYAVARP